VTTVATVTRELGDRGQGSFQRSYEHGIGLLHEVQERVEDARPSLERALALAENKRERAMVLLALAKLEGRQGRVDQALTLLAQAESLEPTSAAVFARRGDVLARVWRWPLAAEAYGKATQLAPGNASLWRRYAVALGSEGSQRAALQAAQRGLKLLPRDADLLRTQALALRSLDGDDAEPAMAAYLEHRGPDNVGTLRLRCAKRSAHCARESLPVHEHSLVSVD
jgi:tetratricopeptide (TPR) repeat protein